MPITLDPTLRRELTKRIRYYNDLGIYDFYRRDSDPASRDIQSEERESMTQRASAVEEGLFENGPSRPESTAADPSQALHISAKISAIALAAACTNRVASKSSS